MLIWIVFSEYFFQNAFSPNETFDFLFYINMYACNKLFRTDYLKQNNLEFPEKIYFEDSIFFFDYWLCASKISLIKDFCYHYRINSLTSTCTANDYNKLDIIKTFKYKKRLLQKHGMYEDLKYAFKVYNINSFKFWNNQIHNKTVKILYLCMILINKPTFILALLKFSNEYFYEVWLLIKLCLFKDKKVVLWGASLFLESFLAKYRIKNSNVLGVIDRSVKKKGNFIGEYQIYEPNELNGLSPDEIIVTIINSRFERILEAKDFVKRQSLSIKVS